MIKKILIANRGEIACRVIATAKKMGIKTVAVYSDADVNALHVSQADEAYNIGPAPSKDSYLRSDKIIAVAKKANADAIHPGYGFLSENAEFAAECEANGIEFVGPPGSAINEMGSKSRSKELMAGANVPLVPGYYGENQDQAFLKEEAEKVGYPVLIKAAFGGGGKGMRIVNQADAFITELEGAKREALAGFGNDKVLIERYIASPRHVEVQIFADKHGNCVYLGDRDCSLQRRHQKVIEEAPAPGLSNDLRKEMGEAAVRCAKAINYVGAGTVEFLLCGEEFFFMEMNTRLQVEHPVTELVTGQDLVAWQLNVASGQTLPLSQEQIVLTGHALEARIYAETPANEFMPCSGAITKLSFPQQSADIRIDTGIQNGSEISAFYDPMIAKLIVYGENRQSALLKLANSLEETFIAGLDTNIAFLHRLTCHDGFTKTQPSTHFIDDNIDALVEYNDQVSDTAKLFASAIYLDTLLCKTSASPWQQVSGFRLNQAHQIAIPFVDNAMYANSLDNGYQIALDGQTHHVIAHINDDDVTAYIDGCKRTAKYHQGEDAIFVLVDAITYEFKLTSKHYVSEANNDDNSLCAPLNGTVVKQLLNEGDQVNEGDGVIIIEAMKMEYTLTAPYAGTLTQYYFNEGDLVSHGDLLANVEESE